MKTKFGTIGLIPGHCGKMGIRFSPFIQNDISAIIEGLHIPTQVPGDFLLDLSSFRGFDGEFAVIRHDGDEWVCDAEHDDVVERLRAWDGILRLRLGKMLSFRTEQYFVRIWNFLDEGGSTVSWNISDLKSFIPTNVARALAHADRKRQGLEGTKQESQSRYSQIEDHGRFSLERAFDGKREEWSPSSTPLHLVTADEAEGKPKRVTPKAIRAPKKPKPDKTGTNG